MIRAGVAGHAASAAGGPSRPAGTMTAAPETARDGDRGRGGHLGFILNVTYAAEPDSGRAVVHLYGRLADGRPFLVRDRRREPYFYVESSAVEQARALGLRDLDTTDRRTLHGVPVHRVRLHRPGDAPEIRARLHRAGVPTYEADVRFPYRYLIDRGIKSALRIHGAARSLDSAAPDATRGTPWAPWETVVFDEPEVEPARWTPALTTLSLDIETDPEAQRLLSVALWGCGAREVLLLCPDVAARAACPAGAVPCAGEAELLATLCARVRALDPDVVTGWNIIDFDVPVLIRRAAALQVPLEMGRAPGAVRQRGESGRRRGTGGNGGGGRRFSDSIFIPGRVVLDGIRLLRAVSYRLDSYSLENAAREILGEGKRTLRDTEDGERGPAGIGYGATLSDQGNMVAGDDHAAQIMRTFHHDPERFVEYNLTDARLVLDILDKLDLVPFTAERSALTGMPPDRVGSSIAAFDFLYLSRLHAHRIVAPTVGAEPHTGNGDGEGQHPMHGGHILKPRPGLHDDVLLFDFKSLYPSIIRTFQIDPVGLIRDQPAGSPRAHQDDDERDAAGAPAHADRSAPRAADGDAIEAPNGARFRRGRGILTELLDDLFTSREKAKAAGNTIASNAIKVLMNSFYGVLGTSACRFSHPLLANAITSFGKHFLLWAKDWMEARGLTVLYGDTDSLFVAGSHRDHGPALAARLNAELAEYVNSAWRVRSYLEMEFETHYERLLLPSVRGGGRGATKRYVGLADGKLQFTGMEVVRRDWTALAHEVQRELYRRLFAGEPVEEYLRAVIGELTAGRRDEQLVYHKALRKDADDYRAAAPHVVAARKRAATQPGEPSSWRGVIDYVITVEGPEPAEGRLHRIDYEHYVERQIRPVAEPVLATTGRDFGEVRRNERQLELF